MSIAARRAMAFHEPICEICGVRRAETDVTARRDSVLVTCHYCWDCAASYERLLVPDLDFRDFLAAVSKRPPATVSNSGLCPQCHRSLDEITERVLAGCSRCYEYFAETLSSIILDNQGRDRHVGKVPH